MLVMNISLERLPLWAALLPLAVYCCVLGGLQLRRRPLIVSGTWDGTLLALGLSGLVAIGPLAAVQPLLGDSPWSEVVLMLLYALVVAVCILFARPRLLIYNATIEQVRPLVAETVAAIDPTARWAGESVALPSLGLQAHVEANGSLRAVSLVVLRNEATADGWSDLGRRVRRAVRRLPVRPSPVGGGLLAVGGLLLLTAVILALGWGPTVVQ